jgi:hypothetical protein
MARQYLITYSINGSPENAQSILAAVTGVTATNFVTNNDTPDAALTVDSIAPSISIGAPSVGSTVVGPVTYIVTYADANFNASTLAAGNISLNQTGTANGVVTVTGTGLTRTVTISSITGDGTLGISIAGGSASDLAGNLAPAAGPSTTFNVKSTYTLSVSKIGSDTGTVTSLPAGVSCGSTCTYDFTNGTTVTLTAAPMTPSTFEGWSGACSGTGPCIITMDADKTVAASFTPLWQNYLPLILR